MGLRTSLFSMLICKFLVSVHLENWVRHTVLDGNGTFHLYWTPPGDTRGDSEITMKIELKTKGYFGLGFSPNGGMPGSDIVSGWIKDGEVYFQDRHALEFDLPDEDYQQDYKLLIAYENDTCTVFVFRRKLETCDGNDTVIDQSTMRVIYAFSNDDPESDDPFYHRENRGSKSILLLTNKAYMDPDLNLTALMHWDVRSSNMDTSSFDSLYWCKIFRSPQLSKKHHIVLAKPLIQEGSEQFVHHMTFHDCIGGTPEEYEYYVDYNGSICYKQGITPAPMLKCEGTIITWAVGGEGIGMPDNAAVPLLSENYYMLEIHYDNSKRRSGIIDNSGLRIYYTPNLRKYDAGDFRSGASFLPRVFIPPGQQQYTVIAYSNPDCFGYNFPASDLFPHGGVKVFAIFLHSHLLARAIKVRHFRGNEELTPLYDDKNYDFDYQEYRYYTEEVDILPGDHLIVECIFDSSHRSNVTFGGWSTSEEMCTYHILYYPTVNSLPSHSAPTYDSINKVLKTNVTQEDDLYRILGNFDWTSVNISKVENAMRYSLHQTQCSPLEFQQDKVYTLASYPKDLIPYEPESTCNITM